MTIRRILAVILPAFFIATLTHGADSTPQDRFSEARTAFEKGEFTKAQYLGEALADEHHLAPELFQLLGNTRYRQGDLGQAALYYQRAALFSPPSAETRQNIAHIRERTGNLFFPTGGILEPFAAWFTRSQWLVAAATCGWMLTFCCVIAFLYLRTGNLRTLLLTIAVLAFMGEALSALGWLWHPAFENIRDIAVVTSKDTRAYAAASTTSPSLVQLPPGSQVRRIDDRGSWSYVELHNENPPPEGRNIRGWVQTESITSLWPYDSACLE